MHQLDLIKIGECESAGMQIHNVLNTHSKRDRSNDGVSRDKGHQMNRASCTIQLRQQAETGPARQAGALPNLMCLGKQSPPALNVGQVSI